jgi:predicted transcriptional regulator
VKKNGPLYLQAVLARAIMLSNYPPTVGFQYMPEAIPVQNSITVSLPDALKTALDEAVQEAGRSPSDLMCEALRDYLFIRKFGSLREHMTSKAQAQGIYTDEDVFDCVS